MSEPEHRTAVQRFTEAAPDLIAGAAGGLLGYAVGGPLGAAAGDAASPALRVAWDVGGQALTERFRRGSHALEIAASELGEDVDGLAAHTDGDPARLELLARVLEAAGRTPVHDKVLALGRVLAQGLDPHGSIDEALILAGALDDVEAPHILLLQHFAEQPVVVVALHEQDIYQLFRNGRIFVPALLQQLVRHGLVEVVGIDGGGAGGFEDPVDGGGPVYACTDLGRHCLKLLRPGLVNPLDPP